MNQRNEKIEYLVYIDFETRSLVDIKVIGAYKYINDPSTEMLCVAFSIDHPTFLIKQLPHYDFNHMDWKLLDAAKDPEYTFVAHNAYFEQLCWKKFFVDQMGFPELPPERWKCTMAKCYKYSLPGALKHVAKVLNLANQKDMQGRDSMLKLSKPRKAKKPTKKDPIGVPENTFWEYQDCPEDFEKMYSYCIQDVDTMRELDGVLRDLTPKEKRIWQIDQRMNANGVLVDLPLIKKAISFVAIEETASRTQFQDAVGEDFNPTQRGVFLEWLNKKGIKVEDTKAATLELILESANLEDDVRTALELCTSSGMSSVKKYKAMLDRSCEDGFLRELYQYHGAHTGRWTGRGAQVQNYPRPTMDMQLVCESLSSMDFESFQLIFGE